MKLLTNEQQESYENAKICKEKVMRNMLKIKLRDHCHYQDKHRKAAQNICNLKYSITT